MSATRHFQVIVIGGGHAGVEAAWAAANLLGGSGSPNPTPSVALVTQDPSKIGVMSCNPAIGGLAKGQIVREIDALGGLMGLATDATGIQFKVLNTSKGPAVHGPRAQCDKHEYAAQVQRMIAARPEIAVIAGSVERMVVEGGKVRGVWVQSSKFEVQSSNPGEVASGPDLNFADLNFELSAPAVVLTTGTFMRGLMHTGESRTEGGRYGEAPAVGISGALRDLGFELGRLKTGTPPRLKKSTIAWYSLPIADGDVEPKPFSDLTASGSRVSGLVSDPSPDTRAPIPGLPSLSRFPVLPQVECRVTETNASVHDCIRANLHRAPMFSGQIEGVGPRYCPSIEDKVVRFAEREKHSVYLEPESLRPGDDEWVYCNGISTSLPADVQDLLVRSMPGCERAEILRYGYAVEYDMVRPHQLGATGMTKRVEGLFLAGQINGTSGYEEAAAQGLVAGINAARFSRNQNLITLGREEAYIGVLMDDLATKTPVEPYRMFTSRAEHRLLLRSDNAADRLTPRAIELGLLDTTELGALRKRVFAERTSRMAALHAHIDAHRHEGVSIRDLVKRHDFPLDRLAMALGAHDELARTGVIDPALFTVHTDRVYAPFIERQRAEVRRAASVERRHIPDDFDYAAIPNIRSEARAALMRFRPATLGQAGRLEGLTPADVTLLAVLVERHTRGKRECEMRGVDTPGL